MIIPVRCITCGAVISDRWKAYETRVKQMEENDESRSNGSHATTAAATATATATAAAVDQKHPRGQILDDIGIKRICCRRHFLGNVDFMDEL